MVYGFHRAPMSGLERQVPSLRGICARPGPALRGSITGSCVAVGLRRCARSGAPASGRWGRAHLIHLGVNLRWQPWVGREFPLKFKVYQGRSGKIIEITDNGGALPSKPCGTLPVVCRWGFAVPKSFLRYYFIILHSYLVSFSARGGQQRRWVINGNRSLDMDVAPTCNGTVLHTYCLVIWIRYMPLDFIPLKDEQTFDDVPWRF